MADAILVLNAGSSSVKFSVFLAQGGALEPMLRGQIEGLFTQPRFEAKDPDGNKVEAKTWPDGTQLGHDGALEYLIEYLRAQRGEHELRAVGHRVVHGGLAYSAPVRIDASVLATLKQFVPLAPLHQPNNLAPIRVLLERQPNLPQVACFDTAFHSTQPALAQSFALPPEITDRGVKRYGFHGLSYEYIASMLPGVDARAAAGRTVVLHLGNGSSMCALQGGRSVASTMGFTAVDGLMMGTRCGAIDPGVILYLIDELRMDARAIEKLIYQQSGLLGVSGISSDMRTLLASDDRAPSSPSTCSSTASRANSVRSRQRSAGSMQSCSRPASAKKPRRSASAFAPPRRGSAWRSITPANAAHGPLISTPQSKAAAWVIPTNEELMIARHTFAAI
jgi:acetate kinase